MNGKAKEHRGGQLREKVMQVVFLIAACISILAVALICIYLFANGLPAIAKIGPFEFLLGTDWRPNADHYGIFPMIIGSIYVTAGAIIVGVPLGLLAAIYMAKFCPAPLYKFLKPAVDLLAGIPSIVVRLLRPDGDCAFGTGPVRRSQRPEYADRLHPFGHYDPSHHYQRFGKLHPRCA